MYIQRNHKSPIVGGRVGEKLSAKGAASPAATWPGPTTVLGTPYPIISSLFEEPTETLKKEIL